MATKKKLRLTLMKSIFGRSPVHQQCVKGLGLRHRHHSVEIEDTPCTRGMIHKVAYLLNVEEV